jgi:hypothetical protein
MSTNTPSDPNDQTNVRGKREREREKEKERERERDWVGRTWMGERERECLLVVVAVFAVDFENGCHFDEHITNDLGLEWGRGERRKNKIQVGGREKKREKKNREWTSGLSILHFCILSSKT